MPRALLTLLAGVIAAVLIGALLSPVWSWRDAIVPVLITTALGGIVLGVTARRAALRDRAIALSEAMNARELERTETTPEADHG